MYVCVTEVNINIMGMNAFLFPMEFLHFGGYLHYSTFDDIIMLCH